MEAVKGLILKMADDALIMGHRNSEWTGLGPVLEEDIAFSSMAQDKIGHAFALYGFCMSSSAHPNRIRSLLPVRKANSAVVIL